MAANRRLVKELKELRTNEIKAFRDLAVNAKNISHWQGLIVPENAPYNKGAFKIDINFPPEYPFKPPQIIFNTKIYHPNINESGRFSLPIIKEKWGPATKMDKVIQAVVAHVNDLEAKYPARPQLAVEYAKDREQFFKNAEKYTLEHSEPRPAD